MAIRVGFIFSTRRSGIVLEAEAEKGSAFFLERGVV